jgi:translation initiation factor 4A
MLLLPSTQCILLSPTVSDDMLEAAAKCTNDSDRARMLIVRDNAMLDGIKQFYVIIGSDDIRLERLSVLLRASASMRSIIFCGTRRKVDWLNEKLRSRGFTVVAMVSNGMCFDGCAVVICLTAGEVDARAT